MKFATLDTESMYAHTDALILFPHPDCHAVCDTDCKKEFVVPSSDTQSCPEAKPSVVMLTAAPADKSTAVAVTAVWSWMPVVRLSKSYQ